ncbi:ATP-grasp domain-containing protein [Paenibacillus sp. FSL H8-0122]|uniref:ATP-grasp domain-containing protein n=1 Tax=Paenibacillus sp. FSL H8-0122 TaxID=2954510 RepID=UPI0030F4C583
MKHLLLVESNESIAGIQACKEMGYTVTLLTQNIQHYLKGQPLESHPLRLVDYIHEVDTFNEEAVVDFVKAYHQANPLTGVMSFAEFYVVQATAAAHAIGVPTMQPLAAKNARNKYKSREICVQSGVPVPRSLLAGSVEEACRHAHSMGYPCIVKPCDGAMSIGVVFVNNERELRQAYESYVNNRNFGRNLYGSTDVLIEEYAAGPLVSVEMVTYQGQDHLIGITDRRLVGFPYFVETGASFPVRLSHEAEIVEVVRRGLHALGVDFGPTHTEVALTPEGPKIIEFNPRMVGGPVPEMIKYATGIDLPREVLRMHMGEAPELTPSVSRGAASREFCSPVDGRLIEVTGLKELEGRADILRSHFIAAGREVSFPRSNFDWIGRVMVGGDDAEQAEQKCSEIQNTIGLHIAARPIS